VSVTLIPSSEKETCLEQIDRLVKSHVLHGSESLCKMLQYLAHHALDHPGVSIKEYQIATEVFGRTSEFDPHLDATVRVQAGRLRSKLAEYYSSVGHEDPILVGLPKGSYTLSFHPRSAESVVRAMPPLPSAGLRVEFTGQQTIRKLVFIIVLLSVLLAGSMAAIIGVVGAPKSRQSAQPPVA
jgi:hypothetical protein